MECAVIAASCFAGGFVAAKMLTSEPAAAKPAAAKPALLLGGVGGMFSHKILISQDKVMTFDIMISLRRQVSLNSMMW